MGIFVSITIFLILVGLLSSSRGVQQYVFGKVLARPLAGNDRLVFWGLCFILLLGFAVRLVATWIRNQNNPGMVIGDEPGYDGLARGLLDGYGLTWPGRVPLYPAWLAAIYLVGNGSISSVRWAQIFWGLIVILLVFALARRIFGPQVGLIAAFLASFSFVLIQQSLRLLSESPYTPVLLIGVIALWDAFQRPGFWSFAIAGAWIGISNLIRPSLFLYPFFLGAILLLLFKDRRAWRYAAGLIIASSIVIAPWVVRNYLRYHAVYPLATSHALLWQGSPEYYHLVRDEGYTYLDVWRKVIYGPDGQAHDPGSIEGDRWWTQRALRSIAAEPGIYLIYALEKTVTYWLGDPNADWGDSFIFNYQAFQEWGFSHSTSVQLMVARFLPVIALAAGIVLRKMWRVLLPIYILLGYNTLLHALTHAEARLSEPLQPFLLVLIAGAFLTLFPQFESRFLAFSTGSETR